MYCVYVVLRAVSGSFRVFLSIALSGIVFHLVSATSTASTVILLALPEGKGKWRLLSSPTPLLPVEPTCGGADRLSC